VDVFLLIGIPFGVFLIAFAWAGYAIGGTAPSPDPALPVRATLRSRIGPTGLTLLAGALTAFGAAAAATAGAFARLTDVGYAVEPAALLFVFEAAVDLTLAILVILPGWSARRAWVLRTVGIYWLWLAGPTMIVADGGPGWLSANPANGMALLGLPAFGWEAVAVLIPALLIWLASRAKAIVPAVATPIDT
jgi:hypothetical protein